MYRTLRFAGLILATLLLTHWATDVGRSQSGVKLKPLTEADIVGLIGNQVDDRPVLTRLARAGIAFKMDESTLARIKQANPSPEVMAALTKFLDSNAVKAVQPDKENAKARKAKAGWEPLDSGVKDELHSVAFLNEQVGVAVGANYTILRTTDGGKTWNRVMGPKDQKSRHFASVIFANDKVGYVRSQFTSDVYRTDDAGVSWSLVKTPRQGDLMGPSGFSSHAIVGDKYFWKSDGNIGGTFIYLSQAGGAWTKLWENDATLGAAGVSFHFTSPTDGWMASIGKSLPHRFFVGRSTDGGKTWKQQEIKQNVGGNYMLTRAVDKDHGWFASHSTHHVHATIDGGQTWTPYALGNGQNDTIRRLQFRDVKTGYVLCGFAWEVRQTNDGGKTWKSLGKIGPEGPTAVRDVYFTAGGAGYAVGAKGFIARFTPGEKSAD